MITSTRERMLTAAESLMREQGLAGAGIHHIVKLSRAPIGSVYHHFPGGKTQYVSEALRMNGEKARALLVAAMSAKKPLAQRLRAFFRLAAKSFEEQGACKGCAIGAVTLDLGRRDDALREVCNEIFASWIDAIEPHLPWRSAKKRRDFALAIVTALEGAFVLARAQKSGAPFIAAGEMLAAAGGQR
jgi:AcrR family transcriptional regulator